MVHGGETTKQGKRKLRELTNSDESILGMIFTLASVWAVIGCLLACCEGICWTSYLCVLGGLILLVFVAGLIIYYRDVITEFFNQIKERY